MDEMKMITGA